MAHKMALIGYGGMANYHHENVKKHITDIEIVAAYDIRKEACEKIVANGLKLYNSPEELYADKEISLVLVATPNDTHKQYAIACLNAGKNVISEKPVTLNAAELEEIIAVAEKSGKFFTVHQNRRWDSDYLTIKKILDDGILKNPYIIESRVQGSRRALHGWRGYKVNGGGMILDWGIHILDQMMNLIPEKVVSVNAHLHNIFAPEVDDNFTAMVRFENGMTAVLNVAMNSFITQPRWHMSCEDGTALIQNWEMDGKIVKLSEETGDMSWDEEIVYTAAGPTRSMAPRPKNTTQELELPKVTGVWMDYYRNIAKCLDGTATPIVKPEQALRVMKVIDLMFKSDATKEAIKCEI